MKTVFSEFDRWSYSGPKISEIAPPETKKVESLLEFMNKIKLWNPVNCPCWICKRYIHKVEFI